MIKGFIGDRTQRIKTEDLLAFLDELTVLARRYKLIVSSDGSVDIPVVKQIPFEDAHQGRYEFFWHTQASIYPDTEIEVEGPVEFLFVYKAELSTELIDIDNI